VKHLKKNQLVDRFNHVISKAQDEEVDVLHSFLDALEKKRENNGTFLANALHIETTYLDEEKYECQIPIQPLINNVINTVHGGITATLIDTAMGTLISHNIEDNIAPVTTELKINYLKPGIGETLTCVATYLHKGKKLRVCEAKVYNDDQNLVAHSTGSFYMSKQKK
jgi:uncharacterized protein (TIGR00369 family)